MSNQAVIYLSDPELKPWLQKQSKAKGVSFSKLISDYLVEIKKAETKSKKNIFLEMSQLLDPKDAEEFDQILQKSKKDSIEKDDKYYKNLFKA